MLDVDHLLYVMEDLFLYSAPAWIIARAIRYHAHVLYNARRDFHKHPPA